jgi:Uncharacterized protein conserved in bacteria
MKKLKNMLIFVLFLVLAFGAAIPAGAKSGKKVQASKQYQIRVNKQQNVVTVYKRIKGQKYKPHKAFSCSTGAGTPTGTFPMKEKMRWHELDGPTYGQYCSRICGRILFHSVWYYRPDKSAQSYVQYNRLGTTASHGCVRLTVWDAKWIYDHCATGTKVVIYNSSNPGPLGKPKTVKVSGYSGWDPTDPDPANPYQRKQPVLSGAKKKTIRFGKKIKLKKGVRARDSYGKNITSKIKLRICHKALKKDKYTKVKKVNARVPGTYKITYSVTDILRHTAKKTVVWQVRPKKKVSSIRLNCQAVTLYVGGKPSEAQGRLRVTRITPKKASYKKVRYQSSNKKIVTVSRNGTLRAKKKGRAVIRVLALDGSGKKAVCRVNVKRISEKPVKDPVVVSGSAVKVKLK